MSNELARVEPPLLASRHVRVRGVVPPGALAAVASYLDRARPSGTLRAYEDAWRRFARWAADAGREALPADEGLVVGYLSLMAADGSPISSVRRARTAIRVAHASRELEDPTDSQTVTALLSAIEARHGRKPKRQAAPLRLRDVHAARDLFGDGTRDVLWWAMLCVGWWGALRRSEIVGLDLGDVELVPGGVVLQLRDTKTEDADEVDFPEQGDARLCPVAALSTWLGRIGADSGPVFRPVLNNGRILPTRASPTAVNRLVQRVARALELPGGPYSAHSLRAGPATELRMAGVPEELAMRHTRHRDRKVFAGYVRRGGYWGDHPMRDLLALAGDR